MFSSLKDNPWVMAIGDVSFVVVGTVFINLAFVLLEKASLAMCVPQ